MHQVSKPYAHTCQPAPTYPALRALLLFLCPQAVLPCAEYYKRQGFPLKKIVSFAAKRDYSDLLVFNEDRKEVRGLHSMDSSNWVCCAPASCWVAATMGAGFTC